MKKEAKSRDKNEMRTISTGKECKQLIISDEFFRALYRGKKLNKRIFIL